MGFFDKARASDNGDDVVDFIAALLLGAFGLALLASLTNPRCPNCNKKIVKDAYMCPHCGAYLEW